MGHSICSTVSQSTKFAHGRRRSRRYRQGFLARPEGLALEHMNGWLATALPAGFKLPQSVHHHLRLRFFSTVELVDTLEREKARAGGPQFNRHKFSGSHSIPQ